MSIPSSVAARFVAGPEVRDAIAVGARVEERYGLDGQVMAGDDGIVLRIPHGEQPPGADLFVFTPEEIEARHRAKGEPPQLGYDGYDRELTEEQKAEHMKPAQTRTIDGADAASTTGAAHTGSAGAADAHGATKVGD